MMAEQKGRGGKKPKYQIADIGGSDLTAQDLSTERVLNFLIRGEAADQSAGTADESPTQPASTREQTKDEPGGVSAEASLPRPEAQGKKSLDHLFRRASAGAAGAKDLKLDLRAQEEPAQQTPAAAKEDQVTEQTPPDPPPVQAEALSAPAAQPPLPAVVEEVRPPAADQQPDPPAVTETRPQTAETQAVTTEAAAPVESDELLQLVSQWKSFYRLKDGEIEVLRVMYRTSHGRGTDECYVKMHNLAEMSNLTYRYCQKVVRSLEQLGWIIKLRDYDPTDQMGVLYRVNLKPSL